MMREILKSKIHNARVTGACEDYVGSITIAKDLMEAANIIQYEKVLVSNVDNGNRFETYAIPGSGGVIEVNGAAAKLASIGDRIIIMSFAIVDEKNLGRHNPKIITVDGENNIR